MIPLSVHGSPQNVLDNKCQKPHGRFFHATNTVIFACVTVYLVQMHFAENYSDIILKFGINGAKLHNFTISELPRFVTYLFFHGGFLHIFANMWILYVIGGHLEKQLGSVAFLFIYFLGGILSGFAVVMLNLSVSNSYFIGASGSISAIMGAFIIKNFRSKFFVLVPILIIPYFLEIPAVIFIVIWSGLQFIMGMGKMVSPEHFISNTEYWSHFIGFLIGLVFCGCIRLLKRNAGPRCIG